MYIPQLLRTFEREGLLPIPIFINGVEGHTVVRDLLTTRYEQDQRRRGVRVVDSLSNEAVEVSDRIHYASCICPPAYLGACLRACLPACLPARLGHRSPLLESQQATPTLHVQTQPNPSSCS